MTVKRTHNIDRLAGRIDNAIKRGLIEAGYLVAQRAAGKAPVDTGRLSRSVTHEPRFQKKGHYIVRVGTNVEYAQAQEFGVGARAEDPSKSKVPHRLGNYPHPYLRPALDESKDEIKRLVISNVVAALRR